jgi:glucan phosphoethanolaminetransferase (alkaline phosphatase superfamily)
MRMYKTRAERRSNKYEINKKYRLRGIFLISYFLAFCFLAVFTLFGLAKVLIQLVQALILSPSGIFTHCKLA